MQTIADPSLLAVKELLRGAKVSVKDKDSSYESEMSRLNFLARYQPKKVESAKIDQVSAAAARNNDGGDVGALEVGDI